MLVSSIDYNEFVGRIAIGRIERGTIQQNQEITVCNYHDPEQSRKAKAVSLYQSRPGPGAGDRGHRREHHRHVRHRGHHHRGHHLRRRPRRGPAFVKISAPTMEMTFSVNDSPFAGREGKYVTSRNLRDRSCGRP